MICAKSGEWEWLLIRGVATAQDGSGEPRRMLVLRRDIGEAQNGESELIAAKELAEAANKARGASLPI